jgi:hypothetical protein
VFQKKEEKEKCIENLFNKIISENFPNLRKNTNFQVQEAQQTINRFNQSRCNHSGKKFGSFLKI